MTRRAAALILLLAGTGTASAAADPDRYMTARLVAESLSPAPGSTILVGLRLNPRPGWHGYWSNPGDAGFAPSVQWSAPAGVRFGPLLHPAPTLISDKGVSSYVHDGEHILLSRMTVPADIRPGTPIAIAADARWAACTATMCVPLQGKLTLELKAGEGGRSADAGAIEAAARKLPRQVSGGAFTADGKTLHLVLPAAATLDPRTARFFPDDNDAFKTALGRAAKSGGGIVIAGPAESAASAHSISGVASDGRAAYRLTLKREEPKSAAVKDAVQSPAGPVEPASIPAQAPGARQGPAGAVERSENREPASRLWPGLLLAIGLFAGAAVALRRRSG